MSKSIEDKLNEARNAYYNTGDAILSDSEYDALWDELKNIDPNNAIFESIGADVKSLSKVKHLMPMGSQNKASNEEEFTKWNRDHNHQHIASFKMDGNSIELIYKNGKLIQVSTRGDGQIGECITNNALDFKSMPHDLSDMDNVSMSIRAEAIISKSNFDKYFDDCKNPRNAASGTIRNSAGHRTEHIDVIAFDIEIPGYEFQSISHKFDILKKLGFTVVDHRLCNNASDVIEYHKETESKRESLNYEIDGIVIAINDTKIQQELGEKHSRPEWAIAYKFEAMSKISTIESVEWQIGQTGKLSPVAKIATVNIGGADINNVYLNNLDEISRLGVQIGDKVMIERRGDIIPKIVSKLSNGSARTEISISNCPECGNVVSRKETMNGDSADVYCTNNICPAILKSRIAHWIKALDIKFIGDVTLDKMYKSGIVTAIPDLYKINSSTLTANDVIGDVMSDKIINEINKTRSLPLHKFIGAFGFPLFGENKAKDYVKYGMDLLSKEWWRKSTLLEGIGNVTSDAIIETIIDRNDELTDLVSIITITTVSNNSGGKLGGKSFCQTGKMSMPRSAINELIEQNGGMIKDSVTSNLDYLIIADVSSTSSKANKARKHGTKLISEDEFMEMTK